MSDSNETLVGRCRVVEFDKIEPTPCPCGQARRAFVDAPELPGTIHRTTITKAAKPHFHKRLTETYYVLECGPDARLRLDDEILPMRPGSCVLIPPGVVHQAIGDMTVLILVFPKFDPTDETIVPE